MWNRIVNTALVYPFLLLGTIASFALGLLLSVKVLLPLLNIACSYAVLYSLLASGQRNKAFRAMLFWALCMGVVGVWTCLHFPDRAEASILQGKAYQEEMFQWIKTGIGAEGNPMQFVPQHLLHFVIFTALSIFTGSLLSLAMGAVLMNYMSFYVSNVIHASHDQMLAILMGWHPWSIIRVASFVILGVILGEPVICKFSGRDYDDYAGARPFFWAALTGLVVDIAMKAVLAPWWGITLRKLIS
jgi:hypothetical protein